MKISYNWLKQFIKLNLTPEDTAEILTDLGLEVEGITPFETVKGGLQGVVVGKVLTCEKHPDADRLKLTTVDIGDQKILQIVCGAPNVAVGQKVAVATIGTVLYDKEGVAFEIKKTKIRGQESHGMLCSEVELGLGEGHDGILVLDNKYKIGSPLAKIMEVESDFVFEIGLTPNRTDAMSHWGVARDLKTRLDLLGKKMEIITPSNVNFRIDKRTHKIGVEVENKELAPRYCGVTISGVVVKESPRWLQNRLLAIGIKPKNNVVDVTNYVLHELGQPLHAFDSAHITGNKIVVKTLPENTPFVTLDGVERKLSAEDLMICDTEKPLCIAGVLGGLQSGVTERTTQVFLESAYFNPVSIRKTAKRHGISTDASFRFERGVDPNTTEYALMRAAQLIKETAGGEITSDIIDIYPKKIQDFQVVLSFEKVTKVIGEEIPKETIKKILSSLELKVNSVTDAGVGITVPAYRNDVTRDIDVIEEILRVYSYNQINTSEKLNASVSKTEEVADYKVQNIIASQLTGLGFFEMMANSLISEEYLHEENQATAVTMLNPLSRDLSVMRQDMIISALEAVSYNHNRKRNDLKLFEFGKTYHRVGTQYREKKHLTLTVSGDKSSVSWNFPTQKTDFFYIKGVVEAIIKRLGIAVTPQYNAVAFPFSEGTRYQVGDTELVTFGSIHKKYLKEFDIESPVYFADFNWDAVLELLQNRKVQFAEIPKFPAVKRDFALLLDEHITFKQVYDVAISVNSKLLQEVNLFDVYQGSNLPAGKKSYAVSFTLYDSSKTLTDAAVDQLMQQLQSRFEKELGASLR
jgi:phenylalanyl-tRNA synthetase beta chain